ncbi:carboxyl-terminal processing protease [Salsuginibacillus halophilus]|uniref:C-terminal processing peptidase n=1 Tax=Salsuginibacillus halophilus TaxID=517424 RepID=A0A2P8H936_9BACI|nr:S41 family peptidase [Salsuginibacillus halophilus]PSL42746.1 carboxyl-terminal processing protease [Salsuginibacillus halophilus]
MANKQKWLAGAGALVLAFGAGGLMFSGGDEVTEEEMRELASSVENSEEQSGSEGQSSEATEAEEEIEADLTKVAQAFEMIQQNYIDDVEDEKLIEGAIEGMVNELDDPFSDYMDAETAEEFIESLDAQFEGIGAEVSMENGYVTIMSPFNDSPAEDAGLQPNDRIIEIDGEPIEDETLNEAVMKIRGEKGSVVTLTIDRPGTEDTFDVDVERDEIPIETVESETYERNGETVGVLTLNSFSQDTAAHFEEHLDELESEGIQGLVVDVRGNPGGYLNSVEDIGDLIIPGGEPVVQIEDPMGQTMQHISNLEEDKDYPMAAVTNEGSASASEILAAAMMESGGHDVVGESSFGKGTVQQSLDLGDGSELKLSLFRWLTADGNDINEEGVTPTVEVEQPSYFTLPALQVDETFAEDDHDEQIRIAQEILTVLNYDPERTDGYLDGETSAQLEAFQSEQGLSENGELDDETATALHQNILDEVRDPANDAQLQKALELVSE